jgi:hypothetical protein
MAAQGDLGVSALQFGGKALRRFGEFLQFAERSLLGFPILEKTGPASPAVFGDRADTL